ncbi:MAG: arylsulfatase [Bacteroidales bacterium]|jgi:arylsulfatase A-like enzyme|nr:arylsulfatase [Bacteroidales bacterium]
MNPLFSNKRFIGVKEGALLGLCSVTLVACHRQQKTDDRRPNIIYILADDLGYGDLGCYGQQLIKTPNIDRLAKDGMRFTRFYAGCPVSAPSRSSLVTGLHTGHTPIRGNKGVPPEGQHPQPADTYTIGKMLQAGGYATGCFGKWGLGYPGSEGMPENQGFETFFGYNCQTLAHNYYPHRLWSNKDTVWLKGNEGEGKAQYAQDVIHREAIRFIRDNKDKPFFAYLTYVLPHAELVTPEDSISALYDGQFMETPFKGVDDGPRFKKGGYGSTPHPKADFAAMITRLDAYVGEVMDVLQELGLDKNTIVVFTSDNGPHREGGADPDFFKSYGPLRGIKRDMYEGGIRVPFIARYPEKIQSGAVSNHVAAFWDVMPTLAELTGTQAAANTDGISFLPALFGQKGQQQHDYLYWEFHEQGGKIAVMKGDWKAVWLNVGNPERMSVELYNLSEDIHEDRNLADEHPDIVAELTKIKNTSRVPSDVWNF